VSVRLAKANVTSGNTTSNINNTCIYVFNTVIAIMESRFSKELGF
jgi:hypothetical protein